MKTGLLLRLDKVIPSDTGLLDDAVDDVTAELDTTEVRISVGVDRHCGLCVSVKDSGSGFYPDALPNPIASENLLARHGRGIFIMRQLMDEVEFKFDHGTEVRMRLTPK